MDLAVKLLVLAVNSGQPAPQLTSLNLNRAVSVLLLGFQFQKVEGKSLNLIAYFPVKFCLSNDSIEVIREVPP